MFVWQLFVLCLGLCCDNISLTTRSFTHGLFSQEICGDFECDDDFMIEKEGNSSFFTVRWEQWQYYTWLNV